MTALPNDYDSDPGRFLSVGKHPHDDVHPYVAARFAAAGALTVLDVGGGAAVREPGPLARAAVGGGQGPEIGFGEVEPGGRIADRSGPAGPGERHDVR